MFFLKQLTLRLEEKLRRDSSSAQTLSKCQDLLFKSYKILKKIDYLFNLNKELSAMIIVRCEESFVFVFSVSARFAYVEEKFHLNAHHCRRRRRRRQINLRV